MKFKTLTLVLEWISLEMSLDIGSVTKTEQKVMATTPVIFQILQEHGTTLTDPSFRVPGDMMMDLMKEPGFPLLIIHIISLIPPQNLLLTKEKSVEELLDGFQKSTKK
jgi:hypothetical protein